MATQPGGAATHYGILYQVLNSLGLALSVEIRGDAIGPEALTLVIEPRGGGGDVVAAAGCQRAVYQYKARSDYGTWSLNQILDDALPDLFKAVPLEPDRDTSSYVLVTEGREGAIEKARAFFRELDSSSIPQNPLNALDDAEVIGFFPSSRITKRAFFHEIASRVTKPQVNGQPSAETLRRMWALLSNFDIRREVLEDVQARVERILLGYVDDVERVPHVAEELYGALLILGSHGGSKFDLATLLRRIDLPVISLAQFPNLRDATSKQLSRRLAEAGYRPATAVRRALSWPSNEGILCIAGGSGMGKTTLLGQAAADTGRTASAVFVATRKGVEEALELAADEVWMRIVGHDRRLNWEPLMRRAKKFVASEQEPWLAVFLDLTANADEAVDILGQPWSEWGVRLAFTADAKAAQLISDDPDLRDRCVVQVLRDMTLAETRELLRLRGRSIAGIPEDVLRMLRQPLLADLYCKLPHADSWRPTNEYELVDAFWRHVSTARGQAAHPHDIGVLLRLSTTFLDRKEPYPWPADVLHRLAISSDALLRLERLGWLRIAIDGETEFAHERFLNWAVACGVVARLDRAEWSPAEVAAMVSAIFIRPRQKGEPHLGYVPMDVLWLLAQRGGSVDEIVEVISSLESDSDHNLYQDLLPTVGPRLVPALHRRMRKSEGAWHRQRQIQRCMRKIAERFSIDEAVVLALLHDESGEIQDTALEVIRLQPQREALDRVWPLYLDRLERGSDNDGYFREEIARQALVACSRLHPEWIRTRTLASKDREELKSLGWLVAELANDDGRRLWHELKPRFLDAFRDDGFRGAINCIDRYRDTAAVPDLERWVDSNADFVSAEAFAALCRLAPEQALGILEKSDLERIAFFEDWWLSPLLLLAPERTRRALSLRFEHGQYSSAALHWTFSGERQIGEDTAGVVIARLEKIIDDAIAAGRADRPPADIEHLIELLGSINTGDGVRLLQDQRRRTLPQKLQALASIYTPHEANSLDRHFVRHVQRLLLIIGGPALEEFLESQIEHCSSWCRTEIRSIVVAPSPSAMDQLLSVIRHPREGDEYAVRRMDALHTVAALGHRGVVLSLLFNDARLWVDDELVSLLSDLPPAADDDIAPMVAALVGGGELQCRAINVLSISGRADLVELLVEYASAEPPDDVKDASCRAVRMLVDENTRVETILRIGFTREPETVAYALESVGTAEALEILEKNLLALEPIRISDDLAWIAARIVTRLGRPSLAEVVWRFVQREHRYFWRSTGEFYEAIGYLVNEEVGELLLVDAVNTRSDGRYGAIRGLVQRDRGTAFEMAHAALTSKQGDRTPYADLLTGIDLAAAVPVLLKHLIHEHSSLLRLHICRALRAVQNEPAVSIRVREMLEAEDPFVRAAGAQAAGWFDDFEHELLVKLSIADVDPMVRAFATSSVWFHMHHSRARALLDDLSRARGSAAWALLEVLLVSGSPLLLSRREDNLWLGRALADQPRAMIEYAEQKIAAKLKAVGGQDEDVLSQFNR